MTSIENKFLTVKEVAKKLKLSSRTIQRIIKERKIEYVQVSKRAPRITQRALDKYLERNTQYAEYQQK